jgi:hypothetical protein
MAKSNELTSHEYYNDDTPSNAVAGAEGFVSAGEFAFVCRAYARFRTIFDRHKARHPQYSRLPSLS